MQIKRLRSVIGLIAITVFCSVFSVMGTQAKADAQNGKKNSLPEVEYLYIESPDMRIRDTENIVVSLAQAPDEIDAVTLVYESESGQEMELKANKSEEQTYLFSKEFEKEGIYTVTKVKYTSGNAEYELLLEDEGIEASFEVGEESSEYAMFSENTDITEEEVEEAVVISDNNESAIVSDVSNALEQVSEDVVPVARSRQVKKSNVVVVLDPGHDSSHTGASGHGVREEVATLKIAQYCKQELEQYGGVTVYMTRTSAACPYPETIGVSKGNIKDIEKRVQWAASKGASSFVSFHLNSASAAAKGAEVYYPSSSSEGKALAQKIQNELTALGLNDRKVKKGDTYAVVKNSIRNGFPGLIIEHAFVSNSSDASNYLSSDAKLRSLGVADATGIAKYYGLSKGEWEFINGKWKWKEGSGNYVVNSWKLIADKWYYFDKNGYMQTGWQFIGNHWYYMSGSGTMLTGWQFIDGYWYYMNGSGAMLTGWQYLDGHWYYLNESGKMLKGLQKIGNQTCYFNSSGWMLTGWQKIENIWYYFNGSGYMVKGEQKIGGTKWYLDEQTGALTTGWKIVDNKWFYYNSNGYRTTGWQKVSGHWYYMNKDGVMLTGWQYLSGHWYYMNKDGVMLTGWQCLSGSWYYMNKDGVMLTGWQYLSGHWYYMNGSGAMLTGWQYIGNKWYYFESSGVWNSNPSNKPPVQEQPSEKPSDKPSQSPSDKPTVEDYYTIEGESSVTVEQMMKWYDEKSPIDFPVDAYRLGGVNSLKDFCQIYYEEAQSENIRVEVAFAQAMHETGWLQFKGQVKIGQFNFAGLGAIDGGASGADFSKYREEGVRMGIRAQIQHLKAYASDTVTENTLANPCVDERFKYVTKGCAEYVEWLGQKENPQGLGWATMKGYGNKIRAQIENLKACKV